MEPHVFSDFSVERNYKVLVKNEWILKNIPKKMQIGKLKYFGSMLHDSLLPGVCKVANKGASFIFLGADWLYPQRAVMRKRQVLFNFHR